MACRVQGAVVGVAMLLAAIPCSTSAWGYSYRNGGRRNGNGAGPPGDHVRLSQYLKLLRRKMTMQSHPDGFSSGRIAANLALIAEHFPKSTSLEALIRAFHSAKLSPAAPLYASDNLDLALASFLNEASTHGRTRKVGNRPWLRPNAEALHGLMVSLLVRHEQRQIGDMIVDPHGKPITKGQAWAHGVAHLHDVVEDNVQKAIKKPEYEPQVVIVQPEDLDDLLAEAFDPSHPVTEANKLIAGAAIARHKLNDAFPNLTITAPSGKTWGVGDGVMGMTHPLFDAKTAPRLCGLPVDDHIQTELLTACLVSQLLIDAGLPELAEIKIADFTDTVHPDHIAHSTKLKQQDKRDRLLVAAARRLFVVHQVFREYGNQLRPNVVNMALVMLQDGYIKDPIRRLLGDDALIDIERIKDAMVGFSNTENGKDWIKTTLKDYHEEIARMDKLLPGMLLGPR